MNRHITLIRETALPLALALGAAAAAQASTVTITGANVTLLSANNINGWVAVTDTTNNGSAVTVQQNSTGTLSRFDPALGVLTNVVSTANVTTPAPSLSQSGGGGSVSASSTWTLGGNSGSFTQSPGSSWNAITVTSSAANLNNFVGPGDVASNSFSSRLTANKTSASTAATGGRISTALTYGEAVVYTYTAHSNASFDSASDINALTVNFGTIASGLDANQSFNILDLGGLGLTNFVVSYLSGDNLFGIAGASGVGVASSGLYNAHFNGQTPATTTAYSGTYRLTFTDDVSGLTQYASNTVRSNSIDLTLMAGSAAPVAAAIPEPASIALVGLALTCLYTSRRRKQLHAVGQA